ncbi:Mitogen-activated protein kinase kinase kinase [Spironucleus salmonicida]|uniref:Kinase, CAMK CAMK1 n=1 Tax=Spironucleus salmonicida TaxID=348837 RepID=V6LAF9_9EUKA|nr:Mitogen-activated protein kinase kinase kinase [Spironucleus salmonicida]|eukprot:EST41397.1 Kinase, CAMK CAMK1 [Spironucleus salmonicida]
MLFQLTFAPGIQSTQETQFEVNFDETIQQYIDDDLHDFTFSVQTGQRKFFQIDISAMICSLFSEKSIYSLYYTTLLVSNPLTSYDSHLIKSCMFYPKILNSPSFCVESSTILQGSCIFNEKQPVVQSFQQLLEEQGLIVSSKLGYGGFGEVYEVIKDNQIFACKVSLHTQALQKEFDISQLIGSCQVNEFQKSTTFACYLMEKLYQANVSNHYDFLLKLAYSIQNIHDLNIIHSDIKLANIMQTADKNIVLIDFGTACRIGIDIPEWNCTKTHMAPEVRSHTYFGKESDIWGFGCVCLEVLVPDDLKIGIELRNNYKLGIYVSLLDKIFVDFRERITIKEVIEHMITIYDLVK